MAALIPALIKLLLSSRGGRGGGGGGYSKGGGAPKPQRSPEEYSMELLDKNSRKAGIQQQSPAQYSLRGAAAEQLERLIQSQNRQLEALNNDQE